MHRYAVLLDTVSIQKYIFAGSKLKENIGASHLVEEVFESYLKEALNEVFPGYPPDIDRWWKKPEEILIKDPSVPFEVGYIGGGNALLFFRDDAGGKSFIKEWSKILLIKVPGIVTAAASMNFDFDTFYKSKEKLFKKLKENKGRFIPQTVIPRHGITAECSRSGYSMEAWNEAGENSGYVSASTIAKIKAAEIEQIGISKKYEKYLDDEFFFTDQLEELGHLKGEDSHIAIVHIDGNGMAQRFNDTKDLVKTRKLSRDVKKATHKSFEKILQEITMNFEKVENALGFDTKEKKIIPLRHIILGGDDITFVCNGKLGIYLAQRFLENLSRQEVSDGMPLTACAGIAVTKAKFPFYRGYELAEQLCGNAKAKRLETGGEDSWIDFHIASGGFSGTLAEIRDYHFKIPYKAPKKENQEHWLFRPFRLGKDDTRDDKRNFYTFIKKTKELKDQLPKSKRMELREVLSRGEVASKTFAVELSARGKTLPAVPGYSFEKGPWMDNQTPYFDMIELIEYYPFIEMEEKGGKER